MHTLPDATKSKIAELLPDSKVWAAQKQQNPALVLRPRDPTRLQKLVPYLYISGLDFAIRCGGIGSSSAKDVVLSMSAFDSFSYNPGNHTIIVGAGSTWGHVEQELEKVAPGRVAVAARVPWVGVAGSMLSGCISWVGAEFGLAADPQNLLDVEIILRDGRKIWASSEPELLWALRGGGGNFGVVTAFHMRTCPYTSSIFAGHISFPPRALEAVSRGVSEFAARPADPKTSFHCHIAVADQEFPGQGSWADMSQSDDSEVEDSKFHLSIFVFDAHGEEHGRGAEGFKWALDIPGAIDSTTVTNLKGVNELQGGNHHLIGATKSYLNACLVHSIDSDFVVKGKKWVDSVVKLDHRLGPGTLFLLENTFSATESAQETAWPHSSAPHVLQLLTGSLPNSGCPEAPALEALAKAPGMIKQSHSTADFFPNFLEPINDISAIFGANYEKLRHIKAFYDPDARFNKGTFIPPIS
ncbi:cysteine desulfurase [Macrophomina phaseolina]|uniref:Cysteine desulfurase n=1 Tax=Macrophomina phaseolina TaxID=35725 RepID=A0ABQ8GEA3_9PEZI|nr:cysteine desulfurase [Macrophomina phaseolina]